MPIPPDDSKKKVPSFNEAMSGGNKPAKIPSFDEVMGEKKNGTPNSPTGAPNISPTPSKLPLGEDFKLPKLPPHNPDQHPQPSKDEILNKTKAYVSEYMPSVFNMASLDKQVDKNQPFNTDNKNVVQQDNAKTVLEGIKNGNPQQVNYFLNKVNSNIDTQIKPLKDLADAGKESEYQRFQLNTLLKKKEQVNKTFNDYLDLSLTSKYEGTDGGFTNSNNVIKIARDKRKTGSVYEKKVEFNDESKGTLYKDFIDYVQKGNKDTKSDKFDDNLHDANAQTFQNFLDYNSGLSAVSNASVMNYKSNLANYNKTGDEQFKKLSDYYKNQYTDVQNKLADAPSKFFPVQVSYVSKVMGDAISDMHPVMNVFITDADRQQAIKNIEKKNPGFSIKYADAIKYINDNGGIETNIPHQGFIGAFNRGGVQGLEGIVNSLEDFGGARSAGSRKADDIKAQFDAYMQGTTKSGESPTTITVNKEGLIFKESKNDNYGKTNINTLFNNGGRFLGGIIPYAAATEIGGELLGGLGKGVGLTEQTAKVVTGNLAGSYLTQYDGNLKIAESLIADNSEKGDFKKQMVANLLSLSQAAAFTVMPVNKYIRENFNAGIAKDALQYLVDKGENGITKSDLQQFISDKVMQRVKPFLKTNGKMAGEMIAMNHANNIIEGMFDETGKTKGSDVIQEDINTLKDVAIGSLFLGGAGVVHQRISEKLPMTTRDALFDIAQSPDENVYRINQMVADGKMLQNDANHIIKIINTAKKELPIVLGTKNSEGMPLSTKQYKELLADNIRGKLANAYVSENVNEKEFTKAASDAEKSAKETVDTITQEPIHEHPFLKEIGVSKISDIDTTQDYEVARENVPDFLEKKIKEPEEEGGKVKINGADILNSLDKLENEKAKSTEGKNTENKTNEVENSKNKEAEVQVKAEDFKGLRDDDFATKYFTPEEYKKWSEVEKDNPEEAKQLVADKKEALLTKPAEATTPTVSGETKESIAKEIADKIYPDLGDKDYNEKGKKEVLANPLGEVESLINYYENKGIPEQEKENSSLLGYSKKSLQELKDLRDRYNAALESENKPTTQKEQQDISSQSKTTDNGNEKSSQESSQESGKSSGEKTNGKEGDEKNDVEKKGAAPKDKDVAPLIERVKEKKVKNYENPSLDEVKEQALQAPASLNKALNDEELTTDLIADNKKEDIEKAIEFQQKRLEEEGVTSEGIEEIDKHIELLSKGLEKHEANNKETSEEEKTTTQSSDNSNRKITGIRNSVIDYENLNKDVKPYLDKIKSKWADLWNHVTKEVESGNIDTRNFANNKMNDILSGKKVILSDYENTIMLYDRVKLLNELKNTENTIEEVKAKTDMPQEEKDFAIEQLKQRERDISSDIFQSEEVLRKSGTNTAQALASRQMMADMFGNLVSWEDYINRQFDGNPPASMVKKVKELQGQHTKIQEELNKHYEEKLKQAADEAFKKGLAEGKKGKSAVKGKEKTLSQSGKDIADQIRKLKIQKGDTALDITLGLRNAAVEAVALLVEGGAKIADAIKEVLKDAKYKGLKEDELSNHIFNGLTRDDLLGNLKDDAEAANSKSVVSDSVGDVKKLMKNIIESGEANTLPELLSKTQEELKNIYPDTTKDELRDIFSGQGLRQEQKTEMEKKVADLKKQATNAKELEALLLIPDNETPAQEAKRHAEINKLLPKVEDYAKSKGLSISVAPYNDNGKVKMALDASTNRVKSMTDGMGKDVAELEKEQRNNGTDNKEKIKSLKEQKEFLSKRIDEINKTKLSDADKVRRIEDALRNQHGKLSRKLREGTDPLVPENKRLSRKVQADLKNQISDYNKQIKGLRQDLIPDVDKQNGALDRHLDNIQKDIERLETKLRTKDFSEDTTIPKNLADDPKAKALQLQLNTVKNEYLGVKRAADDFGKSTYQKSLALFDNYVKFNVLSNYMTLLKLGVAVGENMIFTPVEQVLGMGYTALAHVPFLGQPLKAVMNKAERHSMLGVKEFMGTEWAALSATFTKGAKDSWQEIKKNNSELSILYGHDMRGDVPAEYKDFWYKVNNGLGVAARLHGAEKAFFKRNEFTRSYILRKRALEKKGVNVNDPVVQHEIGVAAYNDAMTSILLGDNKLSDWYSKQLGNLAHSDNVYLNGLATAARYLTPIIKVPSNLVLMGGRASFGWLAGGEIGMRAMVELVKPDSKFGIKQLTPQEADALIRNLKKGTLGLGLMTLGFLRPDMFGAKTFYKKGVKQDDDDLEEGEVKFFGMTLPHWATDNPYFWAMKVGASARNFFDYYRNQKEEGVTTSIMQTAGSIAKGSIEEIPFLGTFGDADKALEYPGSKNSNYFFANQLSKLVPASGALRQVAKDTDKDEEGKVIKRNPQSILEALELSLPLLRKNVEAQ